MGKIYMTSGGGGSGDLDLVTAAAGDIPKGLTIIGPDGEPITGTLELTGTAADSQVLEKKTYYNTDLKTKRTGTMVVREAKNTSLNCGGSYTIPAGYHNGAGKVTANSLSSQTVADSSAGHILKGKTAWVSGKKITGTIESQGALTINPGTTAKTGSVSGKYMTGNITVPAINISAAYIKKGQKITFPDGSSVTGTFEGYVAEPTDLYYMGQNPAGFTSERDGDGIFESNQISIGDGSGAFRLHSGKAYNLTGYSQFIIEGDLKITNGVSYNDIIWVGNTVDHANHTQELVRQKRTTTTSKLVLRFNANITKYLTLTISKYGASRITRIRLA